MGIKRLLIDNQNSGLQS